MKLKSLVLAVALASPMLSASAANSKFFGNPGSFFNEPLATGGFTQTVSFSTLSAGLYDIFGTAPAQNLTRTSAELDRKGWDNTTPNFGKGKTAKVTHVAYNYQDARSSAPMSLPLKGFSQGPAAYADDLGVAAGPAPESSAMLIAALGLLGTIARRRIKASEG
jgi:hypothetical protein